jgi:hypothetical protein
LFGRWLLCEKQPSDPAQLQHLDNAIKVVVKVEGDPTSTAFVARFAGVPKKLKSWLRVEIDFRPKLPAHKASDGQKRGRAGRSGSNDSRPVQLSHRSLLAQVGPA